VEAKEGVQIDKESQTLATITIQNYFRQYHKLAGMTGTAETEAAEFHDIYKLDVITVPPNRPVQRIDHYDSIYKTRRVKYNAIVNEIKQAHAKGQPVLVGTIAVESSELLSRMLKREGIIHNVLNAKYHQQEAEIVARAGQKGGVTIATNMAGRGTDIKLSPGVADLGGLYVIATERHESRRIDRQLRGRCARQGDPGQSKFYISFEDDLMRNFGDSRRISGIMTKLGMGDEEELQHPWLNRSVETAQKRVEQRNYVIRKHTLQYDDVMNQQRDVIYTYRNHILTTDTPRAEVFEVIDDLVLEQAKILLAGGADQEAFLGWLNSTFPLGATAENFDWSQSPETIAAEAIRRITAAYELKVRYEDPEFLPSLERFMVLGAIDRLWQEHLYAMDGLRTSINLRAYGQKDPLIEYKTEAFTMFEELMNRIKTEVVTNAFRSTSSIVAFEKFLSKLPQKLIHDVDVSAFQTSPDETKREETAPAAPEIILPVRRDVPKVGRNDPCPCGSGKKFKNCCGAKG
jgi:preprotein translocase subunit SecA